MPPGRAPPTTPADASPVCYAGRCACSVWRAAFIHGSDRVGRHRGRAPHRAAPPGHPFPGRTARRSCVSSGATNEVFRQFRCLRLACASRRRGARRIAERTAVVLLGTLFVAICAHVSIPLWFTPVPFTLQPFAVLLLALLLSPRWSALTMAVYLAEGAAGLPVFSPVGAADAAPSVRAHGRLSALLPRGGMAHRQPLPPLPQR